MSQVTVVIPVYNEERNVPRVFDAVRMVLDAVDGLDWRILFVDDGSRDNSLTAMRALSDIDSRVGFLELSRNFGKEIATTAGLHHAEGDAVIIMDADLQHPPTLIPTFIDAWNEGADVVIGVRQKNSREGLVKKIGSWGFNKIMQIVSETEMVPRETDFRLISKPVIEEFKRFTERDRMTRALLNWLGFQKTYITFNADARLEGESSYRLMKLILLARNYFLSHTQILLNLAGYVGGIIMFSSSILGTFIFFEKYVAEDPWNMNFSGPAILAVINLFLVGIILCCLWLVALHVGNILQEVTNRPLYVVRTKKV